MPVRGIGLIQFRLGFIGKAFNYGIEPPGSISYGVSK